jgi:hypothetical protein
MAVITPTNLNSTTPVTLATTTLGASDTFAYTQGRTRYLILRNATGGALTPNIDGTGATNVFVPGVGAVDTSAGYTFPSIGAGVTRVIDLEMIREYLRGSIVVTGGDGIVASILEF